MKKKWLWTGIAVACFAATVAVGCGGFSWRDDPGEETTEYEVVFMNGEEEFWSVSVTEGDPVPQPEGTPEKAADDAYTYTFAGWSLEEEGEVTSLATAVSEDMTYYAVFTPESKETVYTVTFVDGVTGEAIDVQRVPLGGDAALPQAPVHEGFTFTGWEGDHTDIDRRTDIVAQYSRNSYTLTLGALGGTSTQEVLFEGALAPEAPEVPQGLLFRHIMYDDLKKTVEHSAGDDVAKRLAQFRDLPAQAAENIHVTERVLHLHLYHVVDKVLIAGSLGLAQQQLHRLPVVADIVYHPMDTLTGLQPHVLRLFLLRQFGKGSLRLHEPPHQSGRVWLHDGGKERLLAGEIAVERTSGYPGIFHDLPQRSPLKALVQKFGHGRLMDFFQRGVRLFFHRLSPYNSVI